ncbi:putative serine carboxypeptidase [Polychaeton citri CBS 116435]|uniref:Serine carboxypeptidase n=1 Tax=Polychaeton citri CBS 116435 TaxID=1314669 RepID=A0A9P4UMI1_9PEZI|nr:putative serine carboxypeptidase [Polychaeton citri CBS 116435]
MGLTASLPSHLSLLLPFLTTLQPAIAQFLAPVTNLTTKTGHLSLPVRYKEVPTGICELTPGVKSYSGYVDVETDEHIFFWFFEARNGDPTEMPLTVWINGGPGSSSMIGLWQELGPCTIVEDGGDVVSNPFAWNNASNLLFIDQPTTVGFSYSTPVKAYTSDSGNIITLPPNTTECPSYAPQDSCGTYSIPDETLTANTTQNAAPNFWKTLQGFMGAFPQYSRSGFHFTTESYGGHYGPVFNEYIEEQNAKIRCGELNGTDAKEIQLKSVMVGNGWYDPLVQYAAYYNYTVYPGNTYDYRPFNESIEAMMYNAMFGPGNCHDMTVACKELGWNEVCASADNFCATEVEFVLDTFANRDEYDIRELMPDPFPYEFYVGYLNSPQVQEALGAFVNFSEYSPTVGNAFTSTGDDDRESGTIEAVRKLVDQGVYVVEYAGDADYNCNWLGGEAVAELTDTPGFGSAGYVNISTSDGVVHGQVKQAANFAFVRIYESGHEVPFYQPLAALEMFERVISGKDVATGGEHVEKGCVYLTVGTEKSTYREGNTTVQFDVLPDGGTYNTTTNAPDLPASNSTTNGTVSEKKAKRSLQKRKPFKPVKLPETSKFGMARKRDLPWL